MIIVMLFVKVRPMTSVVIMVLVITITITMNTVFIHFYDLFPLLSDTVSEIQDKIGKRIYESCLG